MTTISGNTQGQVRFALFGLGLIIMAIGLFEAIPQMVFAINLGLSLCLSTGGAGMSLPLFAELVTHCDGCLIAMTGAVAMLSSRVGFSAKANRFQTALAA